MADDEVSSFTTKPRSIQQDGEFKWGGETGDPWTEAIDTSNGVKINDNGTITTRPGLPTSAIEYWPVNAGSGSTIIDEVNSNHFELGGGTGWSWTTETEFDVGIDLSGNGEYIQAPNPINEGSHGPTFAISIIMRSTDQVRFGGMLTRSWHNLAIDVGNNHFMNYGTKGNWERWDLPLYTGLPMRLFIENGDTIHLNAEHTATRAGNQAMGQVDAFGTYHKDSNSIDGVIGSIATYSGTVDQELIQQDYDMLSWS